MSAVVASHRFAFSPANRIRWPQAAFAPRVCGGGGLLGVGACRHPHSGKGITGWRSLGRIDRARAAGCGLSATCRVTLGGDVLRADDRAGRGATSDGGRPLWLPGPEPPGRCRAFQRGASHSPRDDARGDRGCAGRPGISDLSRSLRTDLSIPLTRPTFGY